MSCEYLFLSTGGSSLPVLQRETFECLCKSPHNSTYFVPPASVWYRAVFLGKRGWVGRSRGGLRGTRALAAASPRERESRRATITSPLKPRTRPKSPW